MSQGDSMPAEVAGEVASFVLPGSGSAVARMLTAVRDEWGRNHSVALRAALKTAGLSREDLAHQIAAKPALVPLVTRLLWEAAMTGQTQLLEAMGAAFGSAVASPNPVPEYELVLGGLRNLRGDDVRLLRHLNDADVFWQQTDEAEVDKPRDFQTVRQLKLALSWPEQTVALSGVQQSGVRRT